MRTLPRPHGVREYSGRVRTRPDIGLGGLPSERAGPGSPEAFHLGQSPVPYYLHLKFQLLSRRWTKVF